MEEIYGRYGGDIRIPRASTPKSNPNPNQVRGVDLLSLSLDEVRGTLPYMTAIAREVLRLYPPVPFVGRTSLKECTWLGFSVRVRVSPNPNPNP